MEYKEDSDDCLVGVHIDWDGTIHGGWGRDTVNEIDVLALKGYIPTFISCKNGNVDQMALYKKSTAQPTSPTQHYQAECCIVNIAAANMQKKY